MPTEPDHSENYDGPLSLAAHQVTILGRPPMPPTDSDPSVITLLASGMGTDGLVNVRGSQGVRITSGPPFLPPTGSTSTDGIELIASEAQKVTVQRGLIPAVDQSIEMTPSGITIDAGVGALTIKSLTQITLSVAGGLSSITITPEGITVQGILIQVN